MNNDDAAKLSPCVAVRFETVSTGPVSIGAVTVKAFDQGPHSVPSLARTHSVSVPEPD